MDRLTSDTEEITVLQDNQKPDSPTMTLDHNGWTNADQVNVDVDQKAKDKDKSKIKTIRIKMGDKDWKDYDYDDAPLTLKEKTEGKTGIQATAIDEAGNKSDMAEATVKIDRTEPEVTFEPDKKD